MSKKKHKIMQQEREHFIHGLRREDGSMECPGCVANGIPEETANAIFDEMSSFASYAFNKSHAAAYAYVAYQTAYLKCHYPTEYMAALLTSVLDHTSKMVSYIDECQKMGIRLLPPDVNESVEGFAAVGEKRIRFGLLAVKNLGRAVVRALIEKREQDGPYADLYDLCSRMYDAELRRKSLETLIRCGACDCFRLTRRAMLAASDSLLADVEQVQKSNLAGQVNLFETTSENGKAHQAVIAPAEEFERSQLLKMEKESIGYYVSGHPLEDYRALIETLPVAPISEILEAAENRSERYRDDAPVQIAAVIEKKKLAVTKKGDTMAYLTAEDLGGSIEVLAFPKILSQYGPMTDEDSIVLLSGRLSFREDEEPKLRLEAVKRLSEMRIPEKQSGKEPPADDRMLEKDDGRNHLNRKNQAKRPGLYLKAEEKNSPKWIKSQKYLAVFDGDTPVYVYFEQDRKLVLAPRNLWVSTCGVLLRVLREELGEKNVVLVES